MSKFIEEKKYYNALSLHLFADYKKLSATREKYGSWYEAYRASSAKLDIENEWTKLGERGVSFLLKEEDGFPELLREIHDCPWGIYYKGKLGGISSPAVAIVGTRRATASGLTIAKKFAADLARAGISTVSGLALGIDTAAHRGTLEGGQPTYAVLARGLDGVYPEQNKNLSDEILANGGAVISEYPLGSPTLPFRFLERNRIVSGLSKMIVVIEAPEESGALVTAKFATEQNRDVGAIPGPINHPNYHGNHSLLKSGAALLTSAEDILNALNIEPQKLPFRENKLKNLSESERAVLEALKFVGNGATVDKILKLAKLETANTQSALTLLLIKDIIRESSGRYELNL